MTRELVFEDDQVRRFEVFGADGVLVGTDEESKLPVDPFCSSCGRPL